MVALLLVYAVFRISHSPPPSLSGTALMKTFKKKPFEFLRLDYWQQDSAWEKSICSLHADRSRRIHAVLISDTLCSRLSSNLSQRSEERREAVIQLRSIVLTTKIHWMAVARKPSLEV